MNMLNLENGNFEDRLLKLKENLDLSTLELELPNILDAISKIYGTAATVATLQGILSLSDAEFRNLMELHPPIANSSELPTSEQHYISVGNAMKSIYDFLIENNSIDLAAKVNQFLIKFAGISINLFYGAQANNLINELRGVSVDSIKAGNVETPTALAVSVFNDFLLNTQLEITAQEAEVLRDITQNGVPILASTYNRDYRGTTRIRFLLRTFLFAYSDACEKTGIMQNYVALFDKAIKLASAMGISLNMLASGKSAADNITSQLEFSLANLSSSYLPSLLTLLNLPEERPEYASIVERVNVLLNKPDSFDLATITQQNEHFLSSILQTIETLEFQQSADSQLNTQSIRTSINVQARPSQVRAAISTYTDKDGSSVEVSASGSIDTPDNRLTAMAHEIAHLIHAKKLGVDVYRNIPTQIKEELAICLQSEFNDLLPASPLSEQNLRDIVARVSSEHVRNGTNYEGLPTESVAKIADEVKGLYAYIFGYMGVYLMVLIKAFFLGKKFVYENGSMKLVDNTSTTLESLNEYLATLLSRTGVNLKIDNSYIMYVMGFMGNLNDGFVYLPDAAQPERPTYILKELMRNKFGANWPNSDNAQQAWDMYNQAIDLSKNLQYEEWKTAVQQLFVG